jgi:hypothetical protein
MRFIRCPVPDCAREPPNPGGYDATHERVFVYHMGKHLHTCHKNDYPTEAVGKGMARKLWDGGEHDGDEHVEDTIPDDEGAGQLPELAQRDDERNDIAYTDRQLGLLYACAQDALRDSDKQDRFAFVCDEKHFAPWIDKLTGWSWPDAAIRALGEGADYTFNVDHIWEVQLLARAVTFVEIHHGAMTLAQLAELRRIFNLPRVTLTLTTSQINQNKKLVFSKFCIRYVYKGDQQTASTSTFGALVNDIDSKQPLNKILRSLLPPVACAITTDTPSGSAGGSTVENNLRAAMAEAFVTVWERHVPREVTAKWASEDLSIFLAFFTVLQDMYSVLWWDPSGKQVTPATVYADLQRARKLAAAAPTHTATYTTPSPAAQPTSQLEPAVNTAASSTPSSDPRPITMPLSTARSEDDVPVHSALARALFTSDISGAVDSSGDVPEGPAGSPMVHHNGVEQPSTAAPVAPEEAEELGGREAEEIDATDAESKQEDDDDDDDDAEEGEDDECDDEQDGSGTDEGSALVATATTAAFSSSTGSNGSEDEIADNSNA